MGGFAGMCIVPCSKGLQTPKHHYFILQNHHLYIRAELKCRARLSDSKAKQVIETIPLPFSERSIITLIITMLPNQASYSTIVVMASKNFLAIYIGYTHYVYTTTVHMMLTNLVMTLYSLFYPLLNNTVDY